MSLRMPDTCSALVGCEVQILRQAGYRTRRDRPDCDPRSACAIDAPVHQHGAYHAKAIPSANTRISSAMALRLGRLNIHCPSPPATSAPHPDSTAAPEAPACRPTTSVCEVVAGTCERRRKFRQDKPTAASSTTTQPSANREASSSSGRQMVPAAARRAPPPESRHHARHEGSDGISGARLTGAAHDSTRQQTRRRSLAARGAVAKMRGQLGIGSIGSQSPSARQSSMPAR